MIGDELGQLAVQIQAASLPAGAKAITQVFATPLQQAPTSQVCPCVVLFVRKTPSKPFTFGTELRTTTYAVQLLYVPIGQSTLPEYYPAIQEYREPILDAIWGAVTLGGLGEVLYATPDCGEPRELAEHWSGQPYFGMEFTVTVLSNRAITILP